MMVLAAYLTAELISLASSAEAGLSVTDLGEQYQVCKMDLPMNVGFHGISSLWSDSVNPEAASTILARQTAVSDAARHADSKHIPPTVDGPAIDITTIHDVFDSFNIFSVEGPTCGTTTVNAIAAFGSCSLALHNALTIDHPILDTAQVEGVRQVNTPDFDRQHTTFDGPRVVDITPIDGATAFCANSLSINVPLTIDGPLSATSPAKDAASFDASPVPYGALMIIGEPALDDDRVDVKASTKSSKQRSRETQAISAPVRGFGTKY